MIGTAELRALMAGGSDHAVLDLRERGAYERGHVYRATSLPRRLLETRLPALVSAPVTPVVLCDEDGRLAELARPTLGAMGYRDVRVLAGGLAGWPAAGGRLVQGLNVPSKVFGEGVLHAMRTPEVTPQELARWIDERRDLVIVDARTPEEYRRGCVPGAVSVPGGELVLRVRELAPDPATTIVVHCGGRTRSYLGAESLRRAGLPNSVVALRNGTMGWELAGLALERGASRWAPSVSTRVRGAASRVARRLAQTHAVPFLGDAELRSRWDARGEENLYVFDVRTREEYEAGHIPGSVWAPGGQLVQATDEYVAVRAALAVLVCDDTTRAINTAVWLRAMGLPRVAVLEGGLVAWSRAGRPVEAGTAPAEVARLPAARSTVRSIAPGRLVGAAVLDVSASDAYRRGHVPGAGWLCRSRLELTIGAVAPDRTQPLVLACEDGVQSTLAAATLGTLGYVDVRVLDGGIRAWVSAGQPVETGATRLLDEPDDVVAKPYERGRDAMVAYLRWEEALDDEGGSPHALLSPPGS